MNRIHTSLVWSACAIIGWIIVGILVLAIFGGVYYTASITHEILMMPPPPSVAAASILRP